MGPKRLDLKKLQYAADSKFNPDGVKSVKISNLTDELAIGRSVPIDALKFVQQAGLVVLLGMKIR